MEYLYLTLLAIGASFIQRTTGFGFGIFIMTMLPFLMPSYGEATTLSGLLALSSSLIVCLKMRGLIDWKHLWPILTMFVIVSAASIFVLARMQENSLRMVLGIALILTSLYFLFLGNRISIRPTVPAQMITGTLSGLMGGFFGMQGPPAVLFFVASEPDKDHYMAIASAYFCIGNAIMTLFRAGNGFLTPQVGISFIFGLAGVTIGTFIGAKVFDKIPAKAFRYIVYSFIGVSGIVILATLA